MRGGQKESKCLKILKMLLKFSFCTPSGMVRPVMSCSVSFQKFASLLKYLFDISFTLLKSIMRAKAGDSAGNRANPCVVSGWPDGKTVQFLTGGKKYVQWIIYETGRFLMKTAFIGTAAKNPVLNWVISWMK